MYICLKRTSTDMIESLSGTWIVLWTLVYYAVKWENETNRFVICGHLQIEYRSYTACVK